MNLFSVLLLGADPEDVETYSALIREVADCKIDVMTLSSSTIDWISRSHYHLIVLDVSKMANECLPLLERLKRASPATGVIVLSETASVPEAVEAIRLGAEDYIQRPFNPDAFKLGVKRGLDRGIVFSEGDGVSGYLHLLNSCQMISASLDKTRILEILRSYLTQEVKSSYAGLYDATGKRVSIGSEDRAMDEILEIAVSATRPFKDWPAGEIFRFIDRGEFTPGMFVFKFRCVEPQDLFCVCLSPERPAVAEVFSNRLRLLHRQVEVTGNNIRQYLGVRNLAFLDDATGLYNTRYMNMILDREITRAKETNRSFAVLFVDADKFKGVNDKHGHLVGTKLLHELGRHLRRMVRDRDTVFRYGGDEFVAVLPGCDLALAQQVAERIRQSVEQRDFDVKEGLAIRFTVSIGVALFPEHASTKKEVVDMADQAMFMAKKASRNCVFVMDPANFNPTPSAQEG